jgi:autotransporter-associated beta strand protein
MKKITGLIHILLTAAGLSVATTLNEWNFYSDPYGKTLSQAVNSKGSASFALASGSETGLQTDGLDRLRCTQNDPGTAGMWTNGAILNASISPVSSGIQYLRYDFSYDLSSTNNDSGCVAGFAFYDSTSNKIAGVALQYDVGATTGTPYTVSQVTELTNTAGTVAVVARINMTNKTLAVWYSLTGDVSGFSEAAPMTVVSNLTLSSFNNLRFQATGDIQYSNSTDQVSVDLLRTADSWSDAIASEPSAPAAKYSNEWTFERDTNGQPLSNTINSGTNNPLAQFSSGSGSTVFTTNRALICTGEDTTTNGVWTNGAILDAALSATTGVHYLRYDVAYDLSSSSNNSGTVLGAYFTGNSGDKAAGLVLGYDTGNLTNAAAAAGRTLTPVTNGLALSGTLTAIAEVCLTNSPATLKVWYSLTGSISTNYSPAAFTTNLSTLTSVTNLRFHATGDFRPTGSTNYALVDNIRHTAGATAGGTAWSEITEQVADLSALPVLTITVSNSMNGAMGLGETNLVTVIISNSVGAGAATAVSSTLTNDISASAFTIVSNNTPVALAAGQSVTNTYQMIANVQGTYTVTAQGTSAQTNSAPVSFSLATGSNLGFLPVVISEPGGTYPGIYEPGETLNITVTTTNDGASTVSSIVNTLTPAVAGFAVTPASANYSSLAKGATTSTVYQVQIGLGVTDGTYLFNITNSAGSLNRATNFSFAVQDPLLSTGRVKANNTTNLNVNSSWVNSIAPNANDLAIFTTNITAALTNDLGADLSWRGISMISNTAAWTINGSNTLTVGSDGINMSQAQANLTVASKLALGTTQTWNVATSRTLTVSGEIFGTNTAPLIKSGAGTLVITNAANTFSGGLSVTSGVLSVGNTNALGTGSLNLQNSALSTVAAALLPNTTTLTNAVLITNVNDLTLSGAISGPGSLTKTGAGKLILTGTNTYSGGTTNYGFIQIGNPYSLGTGTLVMSNSTVFATRAFSSAGPTFQNPVFLAGNGTFTNNTALTAEMIKLSGGISGPGALTLAGYQFYLYGTNTFTGDLSLNVANWIYFQNGSVFGNGTIKTTRATLLIANASAPSAITITNPISMTTTFRLNNNAADIIVLSGLMSGAGVFQRIDNNDGVVEILGNNSGRTGANTFSYGTIRLGHENALGSGAITVTPNAVSPTTIPVLEVTTSLTNGAGVPNNIILSAVEWVNPDNNITTFSPFTINLDHDLKLAGSITSSTTIGDKGGTGLVTIQKNGLGNLLLTGASTTLEPFYVNAGTLTVDGTIASPVFAASGTTLAGTGTVQSATVSDGAFLISDGGMNFTENLNLMKGSMARLNVKTASSALRGNGANTLNANGTLILDFTGNTNAVIGTTFQVLSNWGSGGLVDSGLLVLSSGLPSYTKLDTSSLFVNGQVTVVSDDRLSTQFIEITVPAGATASGSVVVKSTGPSYVCRDDGSWPSREYQIVTQQTARAGFQPAQFQPETVITNWSGNSSGVLDLGFEFPLYGVKYTSFSVNQYGAVAFGGSTVGSNPGSIPYGSAPVVAPYWGDTLIASNSIRYRQESNHMVVAWNNGSVSNKEFQAWLYQDGSVRYLYQYGISGDAQIGLQNDGSYTVSDHTPGTTAYDSLLFTRKSWVTCSPDSGTPGLGQTITFTADATGQTKGTYFFVATIQWSDGQTSEVGVQIKVIDSVIQLAVPATPFTFYGPAGGITHTNMAITNQGTEAISYTITDSGLQGAGYSVTNDTNGWIHIPQTESSVLPQSALGSRILNIGFPFVYFGNVYTALTVNAGGTISLGDSEIISPLAASLAIDANASVRFLSDPGFNRFTVTWENMAQTGGSSNQTFQTVLDRNGSIRFNYQALGAGWPNGLIRLTDSTGNVQGTLSNANTTVVTTNYTWVTNRVLVKKIGSVEVWENVPVCTGTNLTTAFKTNISLQTLVFEPGKRRIISASPTTGTLPANGTTNILITGDARTLTGGGPTNVTTNTTFTFTYSGRTSAVGVTFVATNSTDSAYPALDPLAAADMWGTDDPVVSVQRDAGGSQTVSWPAAGDGLSRTYKVWYTISLSQDWTLLATVLNGTVYTDSAHSDLPVIFYKVTVE